MHPFAILILVNFINHVLSAKKLHQPRKVSAAFRNPYSMRVSLKFTCFSALLDGNGEGRFYKGLRGVCALWVCYAVLLLTFKCPFEKTILKFA